MKVQQVTPSGDKCYENIIRPHLGKITFVFSHTMMYLIKLTYMENADFHDNYKHYPQVSFSRLAKSVSTGNGINRIQNQFFVTYISAFNFN